jgi:hypothetical protein
MMLIRYRKKASQLSWLASTIVQIGGFLIFRVVRA